MRSVSVWSWVRSPQGAIFGSIALRFDTSVSNAPANVQDVRLHFLSVSPDCVSVVGIRPAQLPTKATMFVLRQGVSKCFEVCRGFQKCAEVSKCTEMCRHVQECAEVPKCVEHAMLMFGLVPLVYLRTPRARDNVSAARLCPLCCWHLCTYR